MADEICPHLGVKEDPQTAVAFPSVRNHCFRSSNPGTPTIQHQADFCLCAEYAHCPIFLGLNALHPAIQQQTLPLKIPVRVARDTVPVTRSTGPVKAVRKNPKKSASVSLQPGTGHNRKRDLSIMALLGVGLLAIWVIVLGILPDAGLAFGLPPTATQIQQSGLQDNQPAPGIPIVGITPLNTSTASATAVRAKKTASVFITLTRTKKATRTLTQTLTLAALLPTDNCGPPGGWVLYTIRTGDTLSSLSRIFNISIQQLQAANCMGSDTTIYAGRSIYVPFQPPSTAIPTTAWTSTTAPTKAPTRTLTNPPQPPSATPVTPTTSPPSQTPEPPPPSATPETPSPVPDPSPQG